MDPDKHRVPAGAPRIALTTSSGQRTAARPWYFIRVFPRPYMV